MISSFWVSFGLLIGVLAIHALVPPVSILLRLPALPSNWIVGGLGLALGTARFWTLFVSVNALAFRGRGGLLPDGWFGDALFTLIGLLTLIVYMSWMSAITGERRNRIHAALLAVAYAAIIVAETAYVYALLFPGA